MDELCSLSAEEALARFRDRSLSPVELTEAVIARAEATEPVVNALTYTYFEEALDAAKAAEKRYTGRDGSPRALEGLCVAVKDSGHIAGWPTSAGSLLSEESPQETTSPINQRVLDAGAIVHARSATPEFSCAAVTHSRRWGATRNPWALDYAPGGSSGGAAAALAIGSATLATGSDIAGSIRIPASCCGVVGYKPPRGRNPVDAPFNLDVYCHTGPLARTVGDAQLFQNALSGPHPEDPVTQRPKLDIETDLRGVAGLRIGWSMDLGFFEIDRAVAASTHEALDVLRALGAELVEIRPPWGWEVVDAALTHLRSNFGTSIAPKSREETDLMTPYARAFAEAGRRITPEQVQHSIRTTRRMATWFSHRMEELDVFVCPTTAIPSLPVAFDQSQDQIEINGVLVDPMIGWVLTTPFNMLSTHPVLAVPSGVSASGLPIGLQFVGKSFQDQDVFRAGLAFEAARGPWPTPCDLAKGIRR
ncbi:MAG: amidase [Pseudomonadota bacterium]